jgi:hypothetical protein
MNPNSRSAKPEIRKPKAEAKAEGRNPKAERRPKSETRNNQPAILASGTAPERDNQSAALAGTSLATWP